MIINSSIGSLHDNNDDLPSSEGPSKGLSETPAYYSWTVEKIHTLQSDVATTKSELNHHKESSNSQMHNIKTNLTRRINALDHNINSKINALDAKIDSKFDAFQSEMRTSLSDLRAELKKHENLSVWRVFFAVSVVLILLYPTF
jgi:chromosome segregation ATPase